MMHIVKFSFCGANELIPQKDIIDFLKAHPFAEIGFGVSRQKGGADTERHRYLLDLADEMAPGGQGGDYGEVRGIALHVYGHADDEAGWPLQMMKGLMPTGLEQLAYAFPNMPLQINFGSYDIAPRQAEEFLYGGLLHRLRDCRVPGFYDNNIKFVFQYNKRSETFIRYYNYLVANNGYKMDGMDAKFDVLYDESHGKGITSAEYRPPVFRDLLQGYAGGIGEDNVLRVIDGIAEAIRKADVDKDAKIYLDATGKVRSAENKYLDLDKAARLYAKTPNLGR